MSQPLEGLIHLEQKPVLKPNNTVVSLRALLTCSLPVCTVTSDGTLFGSPPVLAVLFMTRIVKHPKLVHMDAPLSAAGLLRL